MSIKKLDNMHFFLCFGLDCYIKNLPFLGIGGEGACYKLNKDEVLKVYHEYVRDGLDFLGEDYLLKFKNINIDNFKFIKSLVYVRNHIVGSISDYVSGPTIDNEVLYNENILNIITAINDLIESIKKLSSAGIHVGDLDSSNIIFNNNRLYFIDTSKYSFKDISPESLYEENMMEIMEIVLLSVFNYYLFSNKCDIEYFLHHTKSKYLNWQDNQELLLNPVCLINGVKRELEDFCETKLSKFSDTKMVLERKL